MNNTDKKFWTGERFVNLLAIVASVGSLFIIIYQTRLIQKQQYASVMPYLEIWNNIPVSGSFEVALINNGIGPAFIESISVHYKDSIIHKDPANFFYDHVMKDDTVSTLYYASVKKGRVVPANQRITLLGARNSQIMADSLRAWFTKDRVRIEVKYRSIYDEHWMALGAMTEPVKLE